MNLGALLILIFLSAAHTQTPQINAVVEEITVGSMKNYTINNTVEYIISVTNLSCNLARVPPRLYVQCLNCSKNNPAIITFRQERDVISFSLPVIMKLENNSEVTYNNTERTMCPYGKLTSNIGYDLNNYFIYPQDNCDNTVIVSLSTSSKRNIVVQLEVTLVDDFLLKLGKNKTITLTPSTSKFYLFEFTNQTSVVVKVESDVGNCMIISIQNKTCPLVRTKMTNGKAFYQTVTHLGAMLIERHRFPNGFYIKFDLQADDSYCSSPILESDGVRTKTVIISLSETLPTDKYLYVVLSTVAVILVFSGVMIWLTYCCFMRLDVEIPLLEHDVIRQTSTSEYNQGSTDGRSQSPQNLLSPTTDDTLSIKTDSSLDETDFDALRNVEDDKDIFRTKVTLCVSDLAKKNPTILKKKSELYFWNLMTVAIFYGLPASQLVFTYQYNFNQSGDEDICYYNFLCSHPLGVINDFNHLFSNIGYVSLGLLFLLVTHRKEQVHKFLLSKEKALDRDWARNGAFHKWKPNSSCLLVLDIFTHRLFHVLHNPHFGVPQHFGLFYAMGSSLIIEGVLSACYHICPNIYNFQFDASFMYIISTLCMIKIYQSRHPDVNATAYSTFFVMGFVLFFGIWGVFFNTPIFWGIFTALHFVICFYLSVQVYYVGRIRFDIGAIVRYFKEFMCRWYILRPTYPTRFSLIVIINLCNWGIAIAALIMGVKDISSYLLLIFIANLMLYTTFYIIMKLISREKILLQPTIYIFLAVLSWSVAMYYFIHKTISWKKPPAESRTLNRPCQLFSFYDNHDIWHFFSSMGLFFSFLVLLTLDDDLIFIHRCKIPVF